VRLAACDLETLGIYLCGPRLQCALARAIHRDYRLVRCRVAQERPVSVDALRRIEQLVRDKYGQQMKRLRANYLHMIGTLNATEIRARLLAMDLSELRLDDQLRRAAAVLRQPSGLMLLL
jgi:hypothetical protein